MAQEIYGLKISTTGRNHLNELDDLIRRFDARLSSWGKLPPDSFSLENGSSQLNGYFTHISVYRYSDSLVVTDANLLVDYILSGRIELSTDEQLDFAKYVEQELKVYNGKFNITKDSGVFESNNIIQP